jgi:hypothetical protein
MSRPTWSQWQLTIEAKYTSLWKHKIFGKNSVDLDKPHVGNKPIFTKNLDAQGKITRFKVRLMVQGFIQRQGIAYY